MGPSGGFCHGRPLEPLRGTGRTTGGRDARFFAERLRQQVELLEVVHDGTAIDVTVSIGIAQLNSSMADPRGLIEAADRQLYAAKQGVPKPGRGLVRVRGNVAVQ